MSLTIAPDSRLSRAASHLDGAISLARANARADDDELLSPWANTAFTISIAAGYLTTHLPGAVPTTIHPDCPAALRAALVEISQLRADVDLPLQDLAEAMAYTAQALQHAQEHHDHQAGQPYEADRRDGGHGDRPRQP